MRVTPRPLISVGLTLGYVVIVAVTWTVVGLDYDAVGDTTANVVEGIVVPIGLGGIFLAVATSLLGWWGPAVRETRRAPAWVWAVPVLLFLPGVGAVLGGAGPADRGGGYLLALGAGTLLVGFSEEMLTRGTGLVGFRGGFGEVLSWFFSCLVFGLIHALNVFFGQGIGSTVQQIAIAFVAGSALYLTRRVAGTLVLAMLLHAWIDFTTLGFSDAAADAGSPFVALGFLQWGAFVLAVIGVVVVLRRGDQQSESRAGVPVPD
jgi:membrane protease YdiL (CAAX protease family)